MSYISVDIDRIVVESQLSKEAVFVIVDFGILESGVLSSVTENRIDLIRCGLRLFFKFTRSAVKLRSDAGPSP